MSRKRRPTLRASLLQLMVLASAIAIAMVALAVIAYEQTTFKPRAVIYLRQQADTLAAVVLPTLEFNDAATATQYLATRRKYPDIVAVGLYVANGKPVATYVRDANGDISWPSDTRRDSFEFVGGKLHLWYPVEGNGRTAGYLFLCADIPPLFARLPQYGIMAGAVLLALLAVATILLRGLRRNFLAPVEQLTIVTEQVTQDKDYNVRAPVQRDDELGRLAGGLNEMLATVASRDRALRQSEARMRSIIETEPECVTIASPEGELVEVNPAGLAMLEADTLAQARQQRLEQYVVQQHRPEFVEMHRRVLRGDAGALEYEAIGLRGTHRWLDTRSVPLRNADGSIAAALAITRDVSERKAFERALERRSQHQAAVLRLGLEALTAANLDVLFQRAVDTIASVLRADFTSIFELLPSGKFARLRAGTGWPEGSIGALEIPVSTQTPAGLTLTQETPVLIDDVAGDERFSTRVLNERYGMTSAASVAIRGAGNRWGILAASSKRKAAFSNDDFGMLQEVSNVLAQYIQRAGAEVARVDAEAQLLQSQKMDALGRLAGGIAHDFNNLLSAILGNAQLAREDVGSGHPAIVSLEQIQNAGRRAKELVQRILTFSRQQTPRREPLNLLPIVDEVARLLRATIPAGVVVNVRVEPDVPMVLADSAQIHQTLLNLGTNAWQAIGGSGGCIELALYPCDADAELLRSHPTLRPGRYACIAVSDTGGGIDPAVQKKIFDPFFTTKPPGEGTGLGLSVVLGIMQAHGGAITVTSAQDQGASFKLYFPSAEVAVTDTNRSDSVSQARDSGRGERILYLDDEEPLVFLATRLLERVGYRVDGFTRADLALAAFKANPAAYNLVITDMSMPGMSGMDVAREILRIRPNAVVVLASGYLRQVDVDTALALGIREVVLKPNTVEELAPIVHRLVGGVSLGGP